MVHLKVAKRVDPKISHHKTKKGSRGSAFIAVIIL